MSNPGADPSHHLFSVSGKGLERSIAVHAETSEFDTYEGAIKQQLEFQAGPLNSADTTKTNRERMEAMRKQLRKFQQVTAG
ncbi:hypothetical protein T484DRAFT_1813386 [Baffinella frigidus]|nr:hypothetical protein T484DRAFT_1813386 [Cryptophyta sp. CCMP2293]